jgi:hypothetical protein
MSTNRLTASKPIIAFLGLLAVSAPLVMACSAPGSDSATSSGPAGGSGGSTGNGSPTATTSTGASMGPVALPFAVSKEFYPSGYMGDSMTDFTAINIATAAASCLAPRTMGAEGDCYTITWTPHFVPMAKSAWVGVYWQYPGNNWGSKVGKTIAPGAKKVSFYAAGDKGGEQIVFLVGGINNPQSTTDPTLTHMDGFKASSPPETLTKTWTQYSVDLTGAQYTQVLGGFAWTITTMSMDPVKFYLDDIRWE